MIKQTTLKEAAAYYAWVTPGNDETKAFTAGAEWALEEALCKLEHHRDLLGSESAKFMVNACIGVIVNGFGLKVRQ